MVWSTFSLLPRQWIVVNLLFTYMPNLRAQSYVAGLVVPERGDSLAFWTASKYMYPCSWIHYFFSAEFVIQGCQPLSPSLLHCWHPHVDLHCTLCHTNLEQLLNLLYIPLSKPCSQKRHLQLCWCSCLGVAICQLLLLESSLHHHPVVLTSPGVKCFFLATEVVHYNLWSTILSSAWCREDDLVQETKAGFFIGPMIWWVENIKAIRERLLWERCVFSFKVATPTSG